MNLKIDRKRVHVRVAQNGQLTVLLDQPSTEADGYIKVEYIPTGDKLAKILHVLGTQPREGPVGDQEREKVLDIVFGITE